MHNNPGDNNPIEFVIFVDVQIPLYLAVVIFQLVCVFC